MLSILTAMKWPKLFRFDPRCYKWYPELRLFDSDEEREKMLAESKSVWEIFIFFFVILIVTPVILKLVHYMQQGVSRLLPGLGASYANRLFLVLMMSAALGLVMRVLLIPLRKRQQRVLREKLVEKGVPICIECGYDLRGQIEPRCPECGTGFDPKLLKNPPSTDNKLPG